MIGGFYKKKHHGLNEEGVAPSGSGRSVNFISKYKVLSKRKFSVLLNILLCGKKLNFIRVGNGSSGRPSEGYPVGGSEGGSPRVLRVELVAD